MSRVLRMVIALVCLTTPLVSTKVLLGQEQSLLAKPNGQVILTIRGQIGNANSENGAEFDRAMLEALPMVEFVTSSPFLNGETRFRGVPMIDLMRFVGAKGDTLQAVALDLYEADIPISDFETYGVILALEMNGEKLRVRSRGPAWIMYPISSNPEQLDNEIIHSRCVWQLTTLVVK